VRALEAEEENPAIKAANILRERLSRSAQKVVLGSAQAADQEN
jgi:hypothetical protein